jgi:hypothetical protein
MEAHLCEFHPTTLESQRAIWETVKDEREAMKAILEREKKQSGNKQKRTHRHLLSKFQKLTELQMFYGKAIELPST